MRIQCDKLQHKMFWNMATAYAEEGKKLINFNIRCFEIGFYIRRQWTNWDKLQHKMFWNIETLNSGYLYDIDKLQHKMFWNLERKWYKCPFCGINFNIRCFEIRSIYKTKEVNIRINFNIRCFEIQQQFYQQGLLGW